MGVFTCFIHGHEKFIEADGNVFFNEAGSYLLWSLEVQDASRKMPWQAGHYCWPIQKMGPMVSHFSPAKPISHAASRTGSSVATGILCAAYIQCRTWLILDALQKLASCQAGYAIIRKLNIFVPVKLEIKLQYIDNSHITECFRRKAGLVWHWALHPLAECWSAMKCKRFREFCAFCFGQTVKSGQIQRLFGLRRHIAQP